MRRFSHINLAIILCCISFLASVNAEAKDRKGKVTNEANSTFGEGGTRTTFSVRGNQLSVYLDANYNRRLLENSYSYSSNGSYTVLGKTYYNNLGLRDFTKIEAFDAKKAVVQQIISDYSSSGELSAMSTWLLQNGIRKEYNFSITNNQYTASSVRLSDDYNIINSAFPKINISGLKKQIFPFSLSGSKPYRSTEVSNLYTGGKDVTEAYIDADEWGEFKIVEKKAYDKNGVLRHMLYQEYYSCGCSYEEEYYYDCYGDLEYRSYTYFDEYGYDYEFSDEYYDGDVLTSGYYYYDGYNYGEEYYYSDPITVSVQKRIKDLIALKEWQPTLKTAQDYTTNFADCPDAEVFWDHEFYIGPILLKEDGETNFYGAEFSYTRHPCDRGGYTGDIRVNFGSNYDYKFTRLTALVGGVYYPIKTASLKNDFQFLVRGMVGATYLNSKFDNGSFSNSNSNTNFTADAGIGFNYKINNNWGLSLRGDYNPVFAKGFTANNWSVSAGIIFK